MKKETELKDITAVILAGGYGTRLRSVIPDQPKVLAPVGGRPFLSYLLDQLQQYRIPQAVLCTGYRGDQIEAALGSHYGTIQLEYSQEPRPLGTGGAIRGALSLCASDPILILNGDTFVPVDLQSFWDRHQAKKAQATVLLARAVDVNRFGLVGLDPEGRIQAFSEKRNQEAPGWVNGGMYILHRNLLEMIPEGETVSLEREVLPFWVGKGLFGFCFAGSFLDIGTPETYGAAKDYFRRRGSFDLPLRCKSADRSAPIGDPGRRVQQGE